jgi:hypothetical protein
VGLGITVGNKVMHLIARWAVCLAAFPHMHFIGQVLSSSKHTHCALTLLVAFCLLRFIYWMSAVVKKPRCLPRCLGICCYAPVSCSKAAAAGSASSCAGPQENCQSCCSGMVMCMRSLGDCAEVVACAP